MRCCVMAVWNKMQGVKECTILCCTSENRYLQLKVTTLSHIEIMANVQRAENQSRKILSRYLPCTNMLPLSPYMSFALTSPILDRHHYSFQSLRWESYEASCLVHDFTLLQNMITKWWRYWLSQGYHIPCFRTLKRIGISVFLVARWGVLTTRCHVTTTSPHPSQWLSNPAGPWDTSHIEVSTSQMRAMLRKLVNWNRNSQHVEAAMKATSFTSTL